MLVLVESGRGVNLETGVFVGKSLRGAVLLVGDSNLKDRKHKILILLILPFVHISDGGSELNSWPIRAPFGVLPSHPQQNYTFMNSGLCQRLGFPQSM